jgi:hypothetical protein
VYRDISGTNPSAVFQSRSYAEGDRVIYTDSAGVGRNYVYYKGGIGAGKVLPPASRKVAPKPKAGPSAPAPSSAPPPALSGPVSESSLDREVAIAGGLVTGSS